MKKTKCGRMPGFFEAVDHYFRLSFPKSESGDKDLGASSLSGKRSGEVRLGKEGNGYRVIHQQVIVGSSWGSILLGTL